MIRKQVFFRGAILGLATLALAPFASAATYNMVTDFSDTANPNGVWSYFYNGTLFSLSQSSPNCLATSGTLCWYNGQGIPTAILVGQNNTGGTASSGTLSVPTGYAFMDPESQYAAILFTAPSAGTYTVSGNFLGADTGQNSHPVTILANGGSVFSGTISSYLGSVPFSFSQALNAGGTLAFEVLTGSTGCTYCNLTTAVRATITSGTSAAVPEPGSLLLCAAALGMLLLRAGYYARR